MDKPQGGYWFPYLEPHPKSDEYPWRPAYRSTDGTLGRVINLWCETAGEVMAYLNRSGLAPAWSGQTGEPLHRPGDPYGPSLVKGKINEPMMVLGPSEFVINPWPTVPLPETAPADRLPEDDRWDWVDIRTMSDTGPVWIKGQCRHKAPEPVDSYPSGELVAWLCTDCGKTFEPDRWPCPEGMWRRVPVLFDEVIPDIMKPDPSVKDFVDTYADPRLVGPADKERTPWWVYTGAGIFVSLRWDLDSAFLKIWNGIKKAFKITWPVWLVIFYFAMGVITK